MKPNFRNNDKNNYLYTKGKQFILGFNEYVGEYHISGDQVYTGPIHTAESLLLKKYQVNKSVIQYDILNKDSDKIHSYVVPTDEYIQPSDQQYKEGQFERYFLRKLNEPGSTIYEINMEEAGKLGNKNGIDDGIYGLLKITWYITKNPANKDEIELKNKRTILFEDKNFPGLKEQIYNYLEFSEIKFGI